ncbi:MAG: TIGR00296 family protein [Methanomassiliicoccales archaeon]
MNEVEGEVAVRIARKAVDAEARGDTSGAVHAPSDFREKRGAFVTLSTYPAHELRGCIGFPEPVYPLTQALLEAASSACHDPRFPPLDAKELDGIVVEVSVLTPPVEMMVEKRSELPKMIVIGRDGLIMEKGFRRGLLLPQVPVEWGWGPEEFLEQTCHKSGLTSDCWLDPKVKIFSFSAEVFAEESPRGQVVRKRLV